MGGRWWDDEIEEAIRSAAAAVAKRTNWTFEAEDILQEAYLYVLSHRKEIESRRSPANVRWLLVRRHNRKGERERAKWDRDVIYEDWVGEGGGDDLQH